MCSLGRLYPAEATMLILHDYPLQVLLPDTCSQASGRPLGAIRSPLSVLSGWLSLRGHYFTQGFEPGVEAVE